MKQKRSCFVFAPPFPGNLFDIQALTDPCAAFVQKILLSLYAERISPPFDATRENSIFCPIHSGLFFMEG
jgi:hypothetical protein